MSIFIKRVKCQGQKVKYQQNDFITRNIYEKYKSFSTHCSIVISKVKVSERSTELQNDKQDKNNMPSDIRFRGHKNVEEWKVNK